MRATTIRLSSKGQIVIPKEIRDQLHWEPGTELSMVANASGITLKLVPKKSGRQLADLIGFLGHKGPALPTKDLCAPVEYTDDE